METIDIFRSNELFQALNEPELQHLAELATQRIVPKNTMVINAGDMSNSMYLIKSGMVNVLVANDEGREMILATLQAGDHFGELSLLDEAPRSANVLTLERCEFIILHREEFYKLLEHNPMISIRVIKYLCQRVRFITNIAQGLALLDVYGRLLRLLNSLAQPTADGKMVINIPLTHKDIASRVGSSREMISRIFSELEKGEYVSVEHKIITLHKKLPLAW